MGHKQSLAWLASAWLVFGTAFAQPAEDEAPPAPSDLWDRTLDWMGDAWDDTREFFREHTGEDTFPRVWESIVPRLDEALTLEDRRDELPEQRWFGEDQASNRDAFNALLDEATGILSISPAQRYRQRIRELDEAIRQAREELAELRQKRVSAPRDSSWQKTVEDYDAAIRDRELQIERLQQDLATVKGEFAAELRSLGLSISDEQLEFLLTTVVGDDLIEMSIAFDNVKAITAQLEQLMQESREDLRSARRYYGMYTVLLKALERMHRQLIEAIDQRYLPQIDAIRKRTLALMEETRGLQRRAVSEQPILAANLEAQDLTLRTATLYRDYLQEQSRQVQAALQRLAHDVAVAQNTYETVKVSGELVALMQNSQELLESLLSRQVPPLRTFENLEMKREFERLTARLREGAAL